MATEILCTPVGLKTPEGVARVDAAMSKLNLANADAANLLCQILDEDWFGNDPITDNELDELTRTVNRKRDAQDEFLRAIAGLPAQKGGR